MTRPSVLLAGLALATFGDAARGQQSDGCWSGTVGTGPGERRAVLELRRDAREAGRLSVLSRGVDSSALSATHSGDSLVLTVKPFTGSDTAVMAGTIVSGEYRGTMTRRGTPMPFAFRHQGAAPAARHLTGYWEGALTHPTLGRVMRFAIRMQPAPCGELLVTADSPDQGQSNLPVTDFSAAGDSVRFSMAYVGAEFAGVARRDSALIEGSFTQQRQTFGLRMTRSEGASTQRRPQEPVRPLPYEEQEVTYASPAGVRLAGTLTLPRGTERVPAVLLLSGSGAQDRDETIMLHKPFLVLADHLTRQGFAVLRVDDRGIGGSTGNTILSTLDDFATDATAGVAQLKAHPRIDASRIGIVGHSEGAILAPLVARRFGDVAFIVMLAGSGMSGRELLIQQDSALAAPWGRVGRTPLQHARSREILTRLWRGIDEGREPDDARRLVRRYLAAYLDSLPASDRRAIDSSLAGPADSVIVARMNNALTPWFRSFLQFDPTESLRQLRIPVLALLAERDLQVPAAGNAAGIESALRSAGNRDFVVRVMPGLNHLFQHAATGLVSEYSEIEETISPEVLEIVAGWIRARKPR